MDGVHHSVVNHFFNIGSTEFIEVLRCKFKPSRERIASHNCCSYWRFFHYNYLFTCVPVKISYAVCMLVVCVFKQLLCFVCPDHTICSKHLWWLSGSSEDARYFCFY